MHVDQCGLVMLQWKEASYDKNKISQKGKRRNDAIEEWPGFCTRNWKEMSKEL